MLIMLHFWKVVAYEITVQLKGLTFMKTGEHVVGFQVLNTGFL